MPDELVIHDTKGRPRRVTHLSVSDMRRIWPCATPPRPATILSWQRAGSFPRGVLVGTRRFVRVADWKAFWKDPEGWRENGHA